MYNCIKCIVLVIYLYTFPYGKNTYHFSEKHHKYSRSGKIHIMSLFDCYLTVGAYAPFRPALISVFSLFTLDFCLTGTIPSPFWVQSLWQLIYFPSNLNVVCPIIYVGCLTTLKEWTLIAKPEPKIRFIVILTSYFHLAEKVRISILVQMGLSYTTP
jgi:hypothetical protein